MQLKQAIEEYLEHIRHERHLARSTCQRYQSWLRAFLRWLSENGYTDDPALDVFNALVLRRYQMDKTKAGVRPSSIHSAFHSLRGMGEFLVEAGLLTANPVKQLKMPRKDAAVRNTLSDADVTALFAACKLQRTARQIALSHAVLSVLAYGGLRRAEACDLRLHCRKRSENRVRPLFIGCLKILACQHTFTTNQRAKKFHARRGAE